MTSIKWSVFDVVHLVYTSRVVSAASHSTNDTYELYNEAHQRTGANRATRGFSVNNYVT